MPEYSPDGKRVLFNSTRSGHAEIWICDSDGANPRQLTFLEDPLTTKGSWSPDGRQIAFMSPKEKKMLWTSSLTVAVSLVLVTTTTGQSAARQTSAASAKPRVVITQDSELDDVNTVIRALLYSIDFRLEGLVYASASIHFKGDGKGTTQYIAGREYARLGRGPVTSWRWPDKEKWIDEIVDAYAKV